VIEGLKKRWGVSSTWQVAVILVVFSLAGMSILYVKDPVLQSLGIPIDLTLWLKIPLIIILYQILLLFWGTIFGQFRFFWEKDKKMFRFLFCWAIPKS
jgi:hypothetical protein